MDTATPTERVISGAEWLDVTKPDWWTLVDIEKLNINSCTDCILGQVFAADADVFGARSGYEFILAQLDHGWEDYGIIFDRGFSDDCIDNCECKLLKGAWIDAITDRIFAGE